MRKNWAVYWFPWFQFRRPFSTIPTDFTLNLDWFTDQFTSHVTMILQPFSLQLVNPHHPPRGGRPGFIVEKRCEIAQAEICCKQKHKTEPSPHTPSEREDQDQWQILVSRRNHQDVDSRWLNHWTVDSDTDLAGNALINTEKGTKQQGNIQR